MISSGKFNCSILVMIYSISHKVRAMYGVKTWEEAQLSHTFGSVNVLDLVIE